MKLVLASLLLVLAPVAFAVTFDGGSSSEVPVFYASWCSENAVTAQETNGQLVVRENCADKALVCQDQEVYRGRQVVHSATCQPAQ